MRFRELLFLLAALTSVTGLAAAVDGPSSAESQDAYVIANRQAALNSQSKQSGSVGKPTNTHKGPAEAPSITWNITPKFRGTIDFQALVNRDLCYTMRTYKVRPSEHMQENQSGFLGYSSCQQAPTFQFRSADDQGQKATKSK